MSRRLNARIDDDLASMLDVLMHQTDQNLTEVVRSAIAVYFQKVCHENGQHAQEILAKNGFIGCAKGPPDLSTNYKRYLTDSLAKKL